MEIFALVEQSLNDIFDEYIMASVFFQEYENRYGVFSLATINWVQCLVCQVLELEPTNETIIDLMNKRFQAPSIINSKIPGHYSSSLLYISDFDIDSKVK